MACSDGASSEANIAFFVECILHHTISLKLLNYSHFMTREPLFLLHVVKWVVICEYKRVKNYQSKNSFYCILSFLDKNISTSALSWNPIGNRAISTFSGQKPCIRITFKYIRVLFCIIQKLMIYLLEITPKTISHVKLRK